MNRGSLAYVTGPNLWPLWTFLFPSIWAPYFGILFPQIGFIDKCLLFHFFKSHATWNSFQSVLWLAWDLPYVKVQLKMKELCEWPNMV